MRKTSRTPVAIAWVCLLAASVAGEREAYAEKPQRAVNKRVVAPRMDPKTRARSKSGELILALPAGAAYAIDDGASQLADLRTRVLVEPGEHRVHVMSGSRDVVVTVSVEHGAGVVVRLPPADASPPLSLTSVLDAGMTVPPYGPAPAAEPPPAAPAQSPSTPAAISASAEAPRDASTRAAPAPPFSPILREPVPAAKTPILISLATAAASLAAVGTGFAIASGSASSEAAALRAESLDAGRYCSGSNGGGRCARAVDADGKAGDLRAAAIGVLAGAGAFGLSALVVHFAWPKSGKTMTVTGSVSPTGGSTTATFLF